MPFNSPGLEVFIRQFQSGILKVFLPSVNCLFFSPNIFPESFYLVSKIYRRDGR